MWTTMGYKENVNNFNLANAYNGRKLMPLVPRQSHTASAFFDHINPVSPHPPPRSTVMENDKGGLNSQSEVVADVVLSTRWNPTPEQLGTLEDLYRGGTRTPSAEQIQHITARLRRYGKIEGKNVFYWFQNHKARERQKLRRHQSTQPDYNNNVAASDIDTFERNDLSGENRALVFEIEQKKNWLIPTNCSTTLPQELLISLERAGGRSRRTVDDDTGDRSSSSIVANKDTWVQFDQKQEDEQLQQNINNTNENGRWQMSCPPQSYISNSACNLIFNASTTTTSFLCGNTVTAAENDINSPADTDKDNTITTTVQSQATTTTTLQLFPLQTINEEDRHQIDVRDHQNMTYQYFEFLPLKE